jgi:hypothetical protein
MKVTRRLRAPGTEAIEPLDLPPGDGRRGGGASGLPARSVCRRRSRTRSTASGAPGHAAGDGDRVEILRPLVADAKASPAPRGRHPLPPTQKGQAAPGPRGGLTPLQSCTNCAILGQMPARRSGLFARCFLIAALAAAVPAHGQSTTAGKAWSGAQDVAMYALGLIGVTYKFGGSTPDTGLDCSGLVPPRVRGSDRRLPAAHGQGNEHPRQQGPGGEPAAGRPRVLQHAALRVLARRHLPRRQTASCTRLRTAARWRSPRSTRPTGRSTSTVRGVWSGCCPRWRPARSRPRSRPSSCRGSSWRRRRRSPSTGPDLTP